MGDFIDDIGDSSKIKDEMVVMLPDIYDLNESADIVSELGDHEGQWDDTVIGPPELDLSRRFLLENCPTALVCPIVIRMHQRRRRIEALRLICSSTAASITFDDVGGFSISPLNDSPLLADLCSRLSTVPLRPELHQWVTFQVQWVVWTLASYERKLPQLYLGVLLHMESVFLAVSARYSAYVHETEYVVGENANKRFKSKSSMSPLQRCSDIITLVWPLTLCLAVLPHNRFQVTDGWWWTNAILDAELQALVKKVICFFNRICG
jgi:hypothetical protein